MFEFIRSPVYPRWRGEHITVSRPGCIEDGLSPLARGTRVERRLCATDKRFIPAGAGNTECPLSRIRERAVYPRWRGEHLIFIIIVVIVDGLSPLARGTPGVTCERIYQSRFIPAGAGNTNVTHRAGYRVPVYPRWRGEHDRSTIISPLASGLSPLARGTLSTGQSWPRDSRFIPAGAGNTTGGKPRISTAAVYPRWRGEHVTDRDRAYRIGGLSPLARGTLVQISADQLAQRFIPAGAGNTSACLSFF